MTVAMTAGSVLDYLLTLINSSGVSTNPNFNASVSYTRAGTYVIAADVGAGTFDWVAPKGSTVGDAFEIKVDVTSGSFSAGSDSTGVWLALSSTRTYQKTTVGTVNANVSIGRVGASTALITKTLQLQVNP